MSDLEMTKSPTEVARLLRERAPQAVNAADGELMILAAQTIERSLPPGPKQPPRPRGVEWA